MKKNIKLNKQIIKAITLGISASMVLQPMTAFAGTVDGETNEDPNRLVKVDETKAPTAIDTAQANAEAAETQAGNAIESAETVVTNSQGINEAVTAAGEQVTEDINRNEETEVPEAIEEIRNVETALTNMELAEQSAISNIINPANEEVGKADQALSDAEGIVDKANKIADVPTTVEPADRVVVVEDADLLDIRPIADAVVEEKQDGLNALLTDAENTMTAAEAYIPEAETLALADEAYQDTKGKVEKADKAVNEADKELTKLASDLETARTNFNNAKQAIADKNAELETAEAGFNTLKSGALQDAQDAASNLGVVGDDLDALKSAVDNARAEYVKAGYGYIAEYEARIKEELAKPKGKVAWRGDEKTLCYANYFNAIAEFYLGKEFGDFKSINWVREDGKYFDAEGNESTLSDVLNTAEVTYTTVNEDGQRVEVVKYLDYKLVEGNDEKKFGGIVIFEKTAHDVFELETKEGKKKVIYAGADLDKEALEALTNEDGKVNVSVQEDVLPVYDENGNVVVKDAVIVKDAKGKIIGYAKDASDIETLVNETRDGSVVIDRDTETETYTLVDGVLTKTVKADVTTTTFTEANLDGLTGEASTLENEDAAKAAYVAALQEKINALNEGQSIVIGETEFAKGSTADLTGYVSTNKEKSRYVENWQEDVVGYTVSGNYTQYKTGTAKIEPEFLDGNVDLYFKKSSALSAGQEKVDEYNYRTDSEFNYLNPTGWLGLGIIGGDYEGRQAIEATYNNDLDASKSGLIWNYSASFTVKYEEIKSVQVDIHEVLTFFNKTSEAEAIAAMKAKIEEQGGVFVSAMDGDNNIGKKTILYIPGKQVSNVELNVTDESQVEEAFKKALNDQGINAYRTSVTNATAKTQRVDHGTNVGYKTYGYKALEYYVKNVSTLNKEIAKEVWDKIEATATVEMRNDNWYNGENVVLATENKEDPTLTDYTTDGYAGTVEQVLGTEAQAASEEFRRVIDEAAALAAQYAELSGNIASASQAVGEAEQKVNDLKAEIEKIKFGVAPVSYEKDFTADLTAAQEALKVAKQRRDDLLDRLGKLKKALDQKITDTHNREWNTEGGEEGGNQDQNQGGNQNQGGTQGGNQNQGTGEGQEEENPEETGNEEGNPENTNNETETQETTNITDGEVAQAAAPAMANVNEIESPLAAMPEAQQMSWWWLLIVLVLGTTGAELYRRHLVKKNAAKIDKTDK